MNVLPLTLWGHPSFGRICWCFSLLLNLVGVSRRHMLLCNFVIFHWWDVDLVFFLCFKVKGCSLGLGSPPSVRETLSRLPTLYPCISQSPDLLLLRFHHPRLSCHTIYPAVKSFRPLTPKERTNISYLPCSGLTLHSRVEISPWQDPWKLFRFPAPTLAHSSILSGTVCPESTSQLKKKKKKNLSCAVLWSMSCLWVQGKLWTA